jgi:hypothetical protein
MSVSGFGQTSPPQYFSGTGHWYQVVIPTPTYCWVEARDSAAARGGYLGTILSPEENAFVYSLIQSPPLGVWLGGYEPNNDGVWAWTTGELWAYTNWSAGEPSNTNGTERYLGIDGGSFWQGTWNDADSCGATGYLIEYNFNPDSSAWCDDFEDGNGWQSRWTVGHGYPTLVSSPTHGGSGALQMVQQQTGVDCHSSVFRKGFAANTGTYSAWLMQEWDSHFELITQSNKLDGDPFTGTGYRFQISAPHSGSPNGGFELVKNVAGTETVVVPWAPVAFAMNEWVKAFVVRKPGGVIIAGYERINGFRDSLIYVDPEPIEAPGAFYLWTCSDWGQYNYFDDACYQSLQPEFSPFCDNFESYDCSIFPSSGGWSIITSGHGTSEQYVDCSVAYSGTKSFHLSGATNWSAIIHNNLSTIAPVMRMTATMRLAQVDCTPYCIPGYGIGNFGFRNGTDPWGYPEFSSLVFGVLENGALVLWGGPTPIEVNYDQWYTLAVEVNTITKTYSRWFEGQELGSPVSYAGSPDPIGIALVSGNMGHTTTWFDDVCVDTTPPPSTTIWIDSTTIAQGYSQVMMRNTVDVSAFTIPLIHDSPYPIDHVSKVGCRTENWESFHGAIDNAAKTVLIGGVANIGGETPCLPPGEGCVARIYWQKDCQTPVTVHFDSTFIPPGGELLVVDCAVPANDFKPQFVAGSSTYEVYKYGDVNGNWQVDISDAVSLICCIFACGPCPDPYCAGDADGDCKIRITDCVYLINYIFGGGSAPVAGCSNPTELGKRATGNVEIGSTSTFSDQFNTLTLSATAAQQIKGAQLEFATSGNIEIVEVINNVTGMQEFHGTVDGMFKVGLLDLTGETAIPAGTNDMVTIKYRGNGEIKLVNAIMVGTDAAEMNITIANGKSEPTLPTAFSLAQNMPNPFNPTTEIAFSLPAAAQVQLDILNIVGQRVRTLVDEFRAAGNHTVTWDSKDDNGNNVSSGVYFYRLRAGDYADTKKMVLMK